MAVAAGSLFRHCVAGDQWPDRAAIRAAGLGLLKRDRIRYSFRANGEVVLQRVSPDPIEEDPALAPFLALLERDMTAHPERLQPIGADLVRHLQDLVGAIEVDLDEALPDDA